MKEKAIIGIDMGGSHAHGILADIQGSIFYEKSISYSVPGTEDPLQIMAALLRDVSNYAQTNHFTPMGISIGVPGIVDGEKGIVKHAPAFKWRNLSLRDYLNKQFSLPIILENDVNLAVLGEHRFGAGKGVNNLILIAIGTGIGAGIILDGSLYKGHENASGEIGYMIPAIECFKQKYEGFGALENFASGRGIENRAKKVLSSDKIEMLDMELSTAVVFEKARQGEKWATKVLNETLDYLCLAIANISALLNPELIILGGGVSESADLLIEPIMCQLNRVIPNVPRIETSKLKHNAACLGGITCFSH
jgi:glucokinase-like ROK family protein